MLDYASVVDYGADKNGVNNSTAAIEAALRGAGGNIYFPSGTYRCNFTTQNLINFNITGEGIALTSLKPYSPNVPVLTVDARVNSLNGFSISNLTIDGTSSGGSPKYSPGILINGYHNPITHALSRGLVEQVNINNTTTAINIVGYNNGFPPLYGCTFRNMRLEGNTTGITSDGGEVYIHWQDIAIIHGAGDNGYSISVQGHQQLFDQIYTNGPINPGGAHLLWDKITFDGIGANSPPSANAMTITREGVHLEDITLNSIPANKCPIGIYASGSSILIDAVRCIGTDPGTPLVAPGSGVIVAFDTVSKKVTSFNSGLDFVNWQLSPGGTYFSTLNKKIMYSTAAPGSGSFVVGDRVINTNPSASGYSGWVCTSAGAPGTWKGYGAIQA